MASQLGWRIAGGIEYLYARNHLQSFATIQVNAVNIQVFMYGYGGGYAVLTESTWDLIIVFHDKLNTKLSAMSGCHVSHKYDPMQMLMTIPCSLSVQP